MAMKSVLLQAHEESPDITSVDGFSESVVQRRPQSGVISWPVRVVEMCADLWNSKRDAQNEQRTGEIIRRRAVLEEE
jgi:hypothetical protein